MSIERAIAQIRETLSLSRKKSPLGAPEIAILGASKTQDAGRILEAIAHGVTWFGENRVQEAAAKWPPIRKSHPEVELHLIGALQTNKVKEALGLFDVIQTLDRPKLALALAKAMDSGQPAAGKKKECQTAHRPSSAVRFFIQVNTGEEPQKAGIPPFEADAFIRFCRDELKLPVTGLMCVPPANQPPAPHFALLRKIALRHGLKELSMGMSEDYDVAARMGSTCVRIGTALFGARKAA